MNSKKNSCRGNYMRKYGIYNCSAFGSTYYCFNGFNSSGKGSILRLKQIIASVSLKRENLRGLRENFMLQNSNLEHAMRAP